LPKTSTHVVARVGVLASRGLVLVLVFSNLAECALVGVWLGIGSRRARTTKDASCLTCGDFTGIAIFALGKIGELVLELSRGAFFTGWAVVGGDVSGSEWACGAGVATA
jgi:hypothetical protein